MHKILSLVPGDGDYLAVPLSVLHTVQKASSHLLSVNEHGADVVTVRRKDDVVVLRLPGVVVHVALVVLEDGGPDHHHVELPVGLGRLLHDGLLAGLEVRVALLDHVGDHEPEGQPTHDCVGRLHLVLGVVNAECGHGNQLGGHTSI